MYGATSSVDFTAWKQPIFAFVSYMFGLVFTFLCVIFIAPLWPCVCCPPGLADDESQRGAPAANEDVMVDVKIDPIGKAVSFEEEDYSSTEYDDGEITPPPKQTIHSSQSSRVTSRKPKIEPKSAPSIPKPVIDFSSLAAVPSLASTAIKKNRSPPRVKTAPSKRVAQRPAQRESRHVQRRR